MSYNFSPVNNSKMDLDEDGFVAIDWGRFKPPCPRVSYDDYLENMSVISEDGQPSNECSHDNQQQKYPRIYL